MDLWLKKKSANMERKKIDRKLKEVKVSLQGERMTGFKGIFKTNFLLPDYL